VGINSHLGLLNTKLLRLYTELDQRVRPVCGSGMREGLVLGKELMDGFSIKRLGGLVDGFLLDC
jgi:hypothetical protein